MTARFRLTAALLALALAGCDSSTTPTTCESASTVQTTDVTVGTGSAIATVNSTVTLRYVGRLADGTVFDQNDTAIFVFSAGGVIPGFRLGVSGMKIGGRRTIVIPPNLGYGSSPARDRAGNVILNDAGTPLVPACSVLTFDVTLLDERPPN